MGKSVTDFQRRHDDDIWDDDFARDLIDCTILVGLSYVDHDDKLVRRRQVFGTIVSVDERSGIVIRQQHDGTLFTIAPILDAIEPATPGIYQLADEDRAVENPDFTALLTVRSPVRN